MITGQPKHNVLDHGYVKFIESWGSDERIIEAARMSTDGGFVDWDPYEGHPKGDAGLLSYLYRNNHATPFEMAGLVIEVQCPIFVLRQWHRHRTQSYNEMSARYTPLLDMPNFLPTADRCIVVNGTNKQARTASENDHVLTHAKALDWIQSLSDWIDVGQSIYADGLAIGIPKEIARGAVSVNRYSRMRASANLRNWLAFLKLRSDSHAQHEIKVFADVVGDLIAAQFPRTWDLFVAGRQ